MRAESISVKGVVVLSCVLVLTVVAASRAQAQTFAVIHTFTGGSDGANPLAGFAIDGLGNLYGTATYGGTSGDGVVFKLNTSGQETMLYAFTGGTDGANPEANLIMDKSGNLYGTTYLEAFPKPEQCSWLRAAARRRCFTLLPGERMEQVP